MKSLSPTIAGSFGPAMKRCGSRLAVLLAAFFVMFAAHALAQEATIVGTVTDPSGAAVPNATITVTNVETGQVRNLTSSSDGQFVAPDLHIGRYTVRAQGAGFKVVEQTDIVLSVSDRARVDFKLHRRFGLAAAISGAWTCGVRCRWNSGPQSLWCGLPACARRAESDRKSVGQGKSRD